MGKSLKILFVAAEMSPLVKVGGLADVIGSLPQALIERGHDVRVMIPQYGSLDFKQYPLTTVKTDRKVRIIPPAELVTLNMTTLRGQLPVYLVENRHYFGGDEIYSQNDLERFLFFSRSVFEVLPQLDWQPEIVHCHDWHTALIAMWLQKAHSPYATIFTIHNLAYQGGFDETFLAKSGLSRYWESYPVDTPKPPFNFMSQGILAANLVTTVSETYAREIVTAEYGAGLDHLLRYREKDLRGIVNGLDYGEYSPQADPHLAANYDAATIEKRAVNKLALQKRANLPRRAEAPLIGMVQRLDEQKGFDILEKAAGRLLAETGAQLVILGRGREYYEKMLRQIADQYPQQVALFLAFDNPLAHLIYGAADLFLMPSRFEPCGLGQLIAMRYGALPVVRHTGGLVDTVPEFTPDLEQGSGFVFREYTPEALITVVKQGVAAFGNKETWRRAVRRVMALDFSWGASAQKYEAIYQQTLAQRVARS